MFEIILHNGDISTDESIVDRKYSEYDVLTTIFDVLESSDTISIYYTAYIYINVFRY